MISISTYTRISKVIRYKDLIFDYPNYLSVKVESAFQVDLLRAIINKDTGIEPLTTPDCKIAHRKSNEYEFQSSNATVINCLVDAFREGKVNDSPYVFEEYF